jgi:hypothetical protein
MLLPFNTSAFSNTLGASDRAAQRKALVAPFKEEFDGSPEDVLQHIASFKTRCEETGVTEDFTFIDEENDPPSDVDMNDPAAHTSWLPDPCRYNYGNILIDASTTTIEKLQQARDKIQTSLQKFTSPPDPTKMPLASKQLVSFQNRQWIYVLLQTVWTSTMKAIMSRFHELHDQDGVILWFCFLQRFAGTTRENLIEAYSQLSESKLQLSNFNGNILHFTNAVRAPIHRLLKAKEAPSFQHFLYVFHGVMDAPNEEFRNFIINLYTEYRKGGPTSRISMFELLDQLDTEYNCINNLGRWVKKDDSQVLALTSTISTLQSQLSSLMTQYKSLHALLANPTLQQPTPSPAKDKLQKPPPRKPDDPEITEFNGLIWKWCDKCFNGCWNHTHVTAEHVVGIGKCNRRCQSVTNNNNDNNNNNNNSNNNNSPEANLASTSTPSPSTSDSSIPPTVQANVDLVL